MIKYVAPLITVTLVGCSSVPHIEPVATEAPIIEYKDNTTPTGSVPPAVMMAPPPPENCCHTNSQLLSQAFGPVTTTSISEHSLKEIEETKSTVAKIAKKLPKKAAEVLTEIAGSVSTVAEAATTSSSVSITKYDEKGNVTEKEDVHHDSLMEFFSKLLDNMTKLIGLGTGALGLYVGFQKLRSPTVKPETT